MKKTIVAAGLIMIMMLGASYAFGYGPGEGPKYGEKQDRGSWAHWKKLNLTDEQKSKFRELHRKFIEENAQLIGEMKAKRLELKAFWSDPKVDSKTILAKEEELKILKSRMRDKIVHLKLELRGFLTPEQIEKSGSMGRMSQRGHAGDHCRLRHS